MGLFDGLDLNTLAAMFGPNAANAVPAAPTFDDRFGAAFPQAAPLPEPLLPPQVPMPRPNPLQPAPEEMAAAMRIEGKPDLPSVGSALTGGGGRMEELTAPPAAVAAAPVVPPAATDISARARTADDGRKGTLAEALKGVVAPKPPELQKISTPAAPRPTGTIKGGELQALLMALNAGAGGFDRKLPTVLGGR